ncbi:MAG TPA: nucleoside triphosphate pyrophosphatase [Gammaproteobacteria bacterium]|nr:nucleoside triphosphate pyrophosphatase [Gammaproteobacteria bacterium]
MPTLYLASRSPRRRELLAQIGVTHRTIPVDLDETRLTGETPVDYVLRLARAKAAAGFAAAADNNALILGADTTVAIDGDVLGKPETKTAARTMLVRLSGGMHEVLSAVALTDGTRTETALSVSRVIFRDLTQAEIDAYVAVGEGCDKAGGYAIQGRGALFVARLEGSYSGVMGLPLCEVGELLGRFGFVPAENV